MKFILIAVLLQCASLVNAGDNIIIYKNKPLSFVVFDFSTKAAPKGFGAETSSVIKNSLTQEKSFNLIKPDENPAEKSIGPDCDAECLSDLNLKYTDSIFVTGSIAMYEIKTGEKKVSKYVVEDIKAEKYILTVNVIDLKSGKTDLSYKKEITTKVLVADEARVIASDIKDFYLKKIAAKNDIPEEKPEKIKSDQIFIFRGLALMPAFLYSAGSYSNIADYGYGLSFNSNSGLARHKKIFFDLNFNAYLLSGTVKQIETALLSSVYLFSGYTFNPLNNFYISPSMGPGYNVHFIKGEKNPSGAGGDADNNWNLYFNPSMNFGVEAAYSFNGGYDLIFRPSWSMVFEQKGFSSYMMLNLGVRMLF